MQLLIQRGPFQYIPFLIPKIQGWCFCNMQSFKSMDNYSNIFLYIQIQEVQACFTWEIIYRNLSLLLSKISQIQKFLKSFHFWRNCNKKGGVILRVISFLKVVVAFFALFTLSGIAALKLTPCQICIDWVMLCSFQEFFTHFSTVLQLQTSMYFYSNKQQLEALFNVLQCKNYSL